MKRARCGPGRRALIVSGILRKAGLPGFAKRIRSLGWVPSVGEPRGASPVGDPLHLMGRRPFVNLPSAHAAGGGAVPAGGRYHCRPNTRRRQVPVKAANFGGKKKKGWLRGGAAVQRNECAKAFVPAEALGQAPRRMLTQRGSRRTHTLHHGSGSAL